MKWHIGHTLTHVFNNNYINYDAAMSGLKVHCKIERMTLIFLILQYII